MKTFGDTDNDFDMKNFKKISQKLNKDIKSLNQEVRLLNEKTLFTSKNRLDDIKHKHF